MNNVNSFSNNAYTHDKQTLIQLSQNINSIMGANTTYNQLIKNTEQYLNNKYTKRNNQDSIIKNNFLKYIGILRKLYEYNIHYENLLRKYGEKYKNDLELLKKNAIKYNEFKELNAKKFFSKILKILTYEKLKVRKLLTKIKSSIEESFNKLTNENYDSLKKFKNINQKNLKNTKEYKNLAKSFEKFYKVYGIKFNEAINKRNYLYMITEKQQNKINEINGYITKSVERLNKIKNDINKLYKNTTSVNVNNLLENYMNPARITD
jgi:hypothetical protein